MNNDFNYKPQPRRESQPSDESANPNTDLDLEANETPDTPSKEAPAPASSVVTSGPRKSGGLAKFLAFLGVLLLIAAAAGGVYYWQSQQVKAAQAAQASAEKQAASLQSQLVAAKKGSTAKSAAPTSSTSASPTVEKTIVTGEVSKKTASSATITALYQLNQFDEMWIEYGTAPDSLTQSVAHYKPQVGPNSATGYASHTFDLSGLKGVSDYFYRAVAKKGATTMYGGVSSFTTL